MKKNGKNVPDGQTVTESMGPSRSEAMRPAKSMDSPMGDNNAKAKRAEKDAVVSGGTRGNRSGGMMGEFYDKRSKM